MALALDASSPAIVTGAPSVTTAGFTPPAGARLVVLICGNSSGNETPAPLPTVTDNLASHLTYTLVDQGGRPDTPNTSDGWAAAFSARVATSAAMTVTVTNTSSNVNTRHLAVRVEVWTDSSGGPPSIGASKTGGTAVSLTTTTDTVTATRTGSRALIAWSDWNAGTAPTAGAGCTLIGAGSATGITYAMARRTSNDGTAGVATTLSLTGHTSSDQLRWVLVEVVPPQVAAVGQAVETDTATAVARRKTKTTGQAVEASSATTTSATKVRALLQAVGTDTGSASGRRKTRALTQPAEVDAGTAAGRRKALPVSLGTETDTAVALVAGQAVAVGLAAETDSALAFARRKQVAMGLTTETSMAGAVVRGSRITVRPSAGVTVRAGVGITVRPDSGVTVRP